MTTKVDQVDNCSASEPVHGAHEGEPMADIRRRYISGEITAETATALSCEHHRQATATEAPPF